jgi:aldose sugar dehydrogenase
MQRSLSWLLCAAILVISAGCEADAAPLDPRLEVVATGLLIPWSIGFAPDGRIFVTERLGDVRVIVDGMLESEPWATVPAHDATMQGYEMGLMGLAVDPDFATSHALYVCYTYETGEGTFLTRVTTLREDRPNKGREVSVLLDSIPAGPYHNGCRLAVGPDRKLYISTGDAEADSTAQSPKTLSGKILRIERDGRIPADNPYAGSPVWSLGHRNPQGIAWDAGGKRMFASEHGTTGPTGEYDELNVIVRGANYGWPITRGSEADNRFRQPVSDSYIAPSGMTFVTSAQYPEWQGKLIIGGLSSTGLYVADVDHDPVILERIPWVQVGRVRDVMQGPDGYIYLLTSNRDGRGRTGDDDDRLLKILAR